MHIDLQTIFLVRLIFDVLVGVVFLNHYLRHPSVGGPGWWACAALCSMVGTLALMPQIQDTGSTSPMWGFTASTAAFVCGWLGFRSYMGMALPLRLAALILGGMLLGQAALFELWSSAPGRRTLYGAGLILVALLGLGDIRRFDPRRRVGVLNAQRWLLWVEITGLAALAGRRWLLEDANDFADLQRVAPYALLALTVDMLVRAGIATLMVSLKLQTTTDRVTAELKTKAEESDALLENLSACVMVFHPDGTLLSANAAARRFLGWPEQSGPLLYMESIPRFRLLQEGGQLLPHDQVPLNRVLAAQEPVNGMVLGVQNRHRAEVRWALCNGYPQFGVRGELRHVVLTFLDITVLRQVQADQRTLEEQLMRSQKMEALGTLAGGVAHDFNNILAAILGNAELARQDLGRDHPTRESLHEISAAARRGRELVRQILAFSRQQPMERTRVDLNTVVHESCQLLRIALPPHVQLLHSTGPGVPAIEADATQLGQVMFNLGNNAVQALDGRAGTVAFRVEALSADDTRLPVEIAQACRQTEVGAVGVSVADDGCGMSEATAARIFDPFFTTKPVGQGTGLGLPVVLGVVQAHGGTIQVHSAAGQGTTFRLYFVAGAAVQESLSCPVAPLQAGEGGTMNPYEPPGPMVWEAHPEADSTEKHDMSEGLPVVARHIMYLDDDDTLVFLVQRLLERRGYRVSAFSEQEQAIDAVRQNPEAFDLLLTDYNMPGMSGIEVAKQVIALSPHLPVAVASGYITEELKSEADAAGVCEVVFKTDAVEEFCDVVARLVRR